jgi:hypothetical protein
MCTHMSRGVCMCVLSILLSGEASQTWLQLLLMTFSLAVSQIVFMLIHYVKNEKSELSTFFESLLFLLGKYLGTFRKIGREIL